MNKLAVLAFTLLLTLSGMLWYLANGSLNEYLKSQIELQAHYYSNQNAKIDIADYSPSTGKGEFKNFNLENLSDHQTKYVIMVDTAQVELAQQSTEHLLTTIKNLTINKLTLNIETHVDQSSNIEQLIERIKFKLAQDYPELYPNISAKLYAQQNPQLNAEEYAQTHPQAGPIIEHTKVKKKRGKPQPMLNISTIKINTVELNIVGNNIDKILLNNINIPAIGGNKGIVSNQLGGEILLAILQLSNQE